MVTAMPAEAACSARVPCCSGPGHVRVSWQGCGRRTRRSRGRASAAALLAGWPPPLSSRRCCSSAAPPGPRGRLPPGRRPGAHRAGAFSMRAAHAEVRLVNCGVCMFCAPGRVRAVNPPMGGGCGPVGRLPAVPGPASSARMTLSCTSRSRAPLQSTRSPAAPSCLPGRAEAATDMPTHGSACVRAMLPRPGRPERPPCAPDAWLMRPPCRQTPPQVLGSGQGGRWRLPGRRGARGSQMHRCTLLPAPLRGLQPQRPRGRGGTPHAASAPAAPAPAPARPDPSRARVQAPRPSARTPAAGPCA